MSFGKSLVTMAHKIYKCNFSKVYRDKDIRGLCFVLEIDGSYKGESEGSLQVRVFDDEALVDLMSLYVLDNLDSVNFKVLSYIFNKYVGGDTTERSLKTYSNKPFELYKLINEDIGMADYVAEILSLESTGAYLDGVELEGYIPSRDGVGYFLNDYDGSSSCFTLGNIVFYSVLEAKRN